jgi:hypothetical protein
LHKQILSYMVTLNDYTMNYKANQVNTETLP